jgi:hypothetical protein
LTPNLEIDHALIGAVSIDILARLVLLRLLLVVRRVEWVEWSGGEAKGAAACLQAAKSSAASAGTITDQSQHARKILRLLQA